VKEKGDDFGRNDVRMSDGRQWFRDETSIDEWERSARERDIQPPTSGEIEVVRGI
jgi:hypothetical protein